MASTDMEGEMKQVRAACALSVWLVSLTALSESGFAADPIGVPEWTAQEAIGQPPETDWRTLVPGLPMQFREDVSTNERGAADFIFSNSSRLLVGPDCGLSLDERFYDPELDLDVVRSSVSTDTFCVTRLDRVRSLRADGSAPSDVAIASVASELGSGDSPPLPAGVGGAATTLEMSSTIIMGIGADAVLTAGGPDGGAQVFKTSPSGMVVVFGADETAVIRRGGFDVQVTPDGQLIGPNPTDPAALRTAQLRLASIEPPSGPRPDLPYILETFPEQLNERVRLRDPVTIDPPDRCQLTDTCLGIQRVIEIIDSPRVTGPVQVIVPPGAMNTMVVPGMGPGMMMMPGAD